MMKSISAARGVVCAVGDLGTVYLIQRGGAAPLRQRLPGRPRLFAVAVYNQALSYAVGERGEIWRWQGRCWEALRPFTAADLVAVRVVAPGDVVVSAADGRLWRLDGNARPVCMLEGERHRGRPVRVAALWSGGPGELWTAAGEVVQRLQGARQAERWELPGVDLLALAGEAGGAVYAIGAGVGYRLERGGERQRLATAADCAGAACGPGGALYIVGGDELRTWAPGVGWRTVFKAPGPLVGVAVDDDGAVWLAGADGIFCHNPAPGEDGPRERSRTGACGARLGNSEPARAQAQAQA